MKPLKFDLEWGVILCCAVLYGINIYASTGIYDLNDGLAHFVIAKYASAHPHLFLDHWGKPLFTILVSPFTQLGIKGVLLFNTLVFIASARFLVLLGKQLELPQMWAAPIFLALAPAYYQVMMGGLTEVLFAGIVVAGLYYFSKEKYVLAALLITWLPFARSEAYFVVPFFALAFVAKRQWLPLVLLGVGPFVMSILGWFVFDDFFWMISNNPYTGAKDIYGSGEPWFFLEKFGQIPGEFIRNSAVVGLFLFIGLGFFKRNHAQLPTLLIAAACGVSILAAHSIFWWKGLYGSMGLLRVLATIIPLCILFAFYAFSWVSRFVNSKWLIPFLLYGFYITYGNTAYLHPFAKGPEKEERQIQLLADWYNHSTFKDTKNVWYMQPAIGYYLEIDNFSENDSRQLWYLNHVLPSNSIRNGGLIIWDAARGPSEGKTSKEMLLADRHLKLVKSIISEADTTLENDFLVELLLFEKQIDSSNDTLAFADFNAINRPILEHRLDRILREDSTGRKYFSMETITASYDVFTFWEADRASWEAKYYTFKMATSAEPELFLTTEFEDGSSDLQSVDRMNFVLPTFKKPVVKTSLVVKNNKEEALRVYRWELLKTN